MSGDQGSPHPLVEVQGIHKTYRTGKVEYQALKGLDLTFNEAEFTAVVGPSGSGKSTLLHLIGGLDRPTSGSLRVNGSEIANLSSRRLAEYRGKTIGFVFQFFNLIPYLTARENVELSLSIAGVGGRERSRRALELLKTFGLGELAGKKPTELSGGEQQRVAIARALVNKPRIVLADEPTGNLDTGTSTIVMEAFRSLVEKDRMSVIMVTHNLELTNYCDRVVRLRDGKLEKIEVNNK